ncbi:PREDICTED: protein transport protein SEC16B homolog [Tarenaya hassleriana]|uniref:protein transport protein SEC16B homolog n=1 Tax=Tarenaya hassleriana TaxID=28532 RepID=UPI00053C99B4|nr:PREDICTED: protein transport protein SEC16B homolog [Tarenaya hassleriana]
MASTSQFQVEDQTDEDFFDKLVDDDFNPSEAQASSSATGMKLEDGNDSDDATAFANLSISDDSGGDGTLLEAEGGNDSAKTNIGAITSEAAEFIRSNANKSSNEGLLSEEVAISATAGESPILDGSGGSGIKEVGWSSFYMDSSVNNGQGFGSYSDFLSQFEEDAVDSQGKAKEYITGGGNIVSNNSNNKNIGLDNSVGLGHQGELHSAYANGQDTDISQYWENLYPGWKYDANTREWYQVDGHEENMNLQGNYGHSTDDWSGGSAGKSDVAHLQQSTQSAIETVTETGTTESVSGWNQLSHVNNGYPEHMVFDPQYPGWYYDTVAQEWLTLDSYIPAAQTTGLDAHNQQVQNGYVSTGYSGHSNSSDMYGEYGQKQTLATQEFSSQAQQSMWDQSSYVYNNTWQSETAARAETTVTSSLSSFVVNQQMNSNYSTEAVAEQPAVAQTFGKTSQPQFKTNEIGVQSFSPPYKDTGVFQQKGPVNFSNDFYGVQKSPNVAQQSFQSSQQFFPAPTVGRSPDGRPIHTLVSFGFGGKLIVMKDNSGSLQNSSFGSQGTMGSSISVLNLAEVFTGNANTSNMGGGTSGYFHCLCQQSFPGPLVGGNVGSKDLNKWLDERIVNCDSLEVDFSRGQLLRLLLSLLKISCQYYGKLRSPFGTETTQQDTNTPEAAVAKLFAFAQKDGIQNVSQAALGQCVLHLPPEAQMQVTASEVQSLLVSGRKMDALQCAQEGQLWGPALVIAAQLGDQFYVDTVKQMALRQLVPGSPLRTLYLLIAGQPAEVFSTGSAGGSSLPGSMHMSQHQPQFGSDSMLGNWEENLAIITANRTKDDELVITHLGDCLWKERREIIAAHICYLVAETNFEPYSDGARLCLVGADHWKYPRTYASPEAIQRTELYEYSKVLGNSQYILLPFQPYKLIYAHMLAEVGKVSDALKYCQAVLKCLKTGRAPEVEMWKQLVLSLEERIRIHQQGGYTANLAPGKLVGKLLNLFDSTAHRVVGGMPPPAPSLSTGNFLVNEYNHQQRAAAGVSTSQPAMTMPSLMPSVSMEPIREWGGGESKMTVQARSVSEPVFGRTPKQDEVGSLKEKALDGVMSQEKSSEAGTGSRLSRFGFGILKKTVGRVLQARPSREAKLGEENKFYYDDKLKRWVEKGVEPPAEEAALPPPPTTAAFHTNSPGSSLGSDSNNEMSPPSGNQSFGSPAPSENSSGMPPIPSGSNQFSARGRMGVRSRYVDTFNQGRGSPGSMFHSPPVPSAKSSMPTNTKFFIPTTPPVTPENEEKGGEEAGETRSQPPSQSLTSSSSSPETAINSRFPSIDDNNNIRRTGSGTNVKRERGLPPASSRRTASWSGSSSSDPQQVMSSPPIPLHPISSFGVDELQEVQL